MAIFTNVQYPFLPYTTHTVNIVYMDGLCRCGVSWVQDVYRCSDCVFLFNLRIYFLNLIRYYKAVKTIPVSHLYVLKPQKEIRR